MHFRLGKQPGFWGLWNVSAFNLFLGSRESFRAYFRCYNSLFIFAAPTFLGVKLRSPFCEHVKRSAFNVSGLQFVIWLFGPEKSSGISRNRLLVLDRNRCCRGIQGGVAIKLQQLNAPGWRCASQVGLLTFRYYLCLQIYLHIYNEYIVWAICLENKFGFGGGGSWLHFSATHTSSGKHLP